uniref:Dsba oxidoreductase n=1 Tax=Tetraselmis sp. GSL018 TaxID=582737 RepID=A0A061S152_9CHLO
MLTFQGRADFVVNWRPFQLNPSASREGVNKLEMYREKFGEERLRQIMPRLTQVFAEEGLKYSLGGLTGNTLNSHRLVAAAERVGLGSALVEELMKGYFTEERFINDRHGPVTGQLWSTHPLIFGSHHSTRQQSAPVPLHKSLHERVRPPSSRQGIPPRGCKQGRPPRCRVRGER